MNLRFLSLDFLLEVANFGVVSCPLGEDPGALRLDIALELPIDLAQLFKAFVCLFELKVRGITLLLEAVTLVEETWTFST